MSQSNASIKRNEFVSPTSSRNFVLVHKSDMKIIDFGNSHITWRGHAIIRGLLTASGLESTIIESQRPPQLKKKKSSSLKSTAVHTFYPLVLSKTFDSAMSIEESEPLQPPFSTWPHCVSPHAVPSPVMAFPSPTCIEDRRWTEEETGQQTSTSMSGVTSLQRENWK